MSKKKENTVESGGLLGEILCDLKEDGAQLLGSEGLQLKIKGVISTGDPGIDNAIGRGGIPLGRLTVLHGKEGSGKTTLALQIVAECQKKNGIVIYIDHEYKLDPDYARALGVNTEKLVIVQPPYLERVFSMVEKVVSVAAEKRKKTKTRVPILVVHDSINAAITKAEFNGKWEDHHVAPSARVYSNLLPKLMPSVSKEDISLLFISQMRKKIGVMFGDPSEIAGGSAVKHWASLIGRITTVGTVKDSAEGEKGGEKVANKVKIEFIKNQISPPFRRALCHIVYGKGFDKENSLIELGLKKGVIKKVKNTYLTVKEEKPLGSSLKKANEFLKNSPKIYSTLLKRINKK